MATDKDHALLEKIYTTEGGPGSYGSTDELWREARRQGSRLSRAAVGRWVAAFDSENRFRDGRRQPITIFAVAYNHKWMADLGFMPPFRGYIGFLIWYAMVGNGKT